MSAKGVYQYGIGLLILAVIGVVLSQTTTVDKPVTVYDTVPYEHQVVSDRTYEETHIPYVWEARYAEVAVKNLDSITGVFGVDFTGVNDGSVVEAKYIEHKVKPGETKIFKTDVSSDVEVQYNVIVPTKQVPRTEMVKQEVPLWEYLSLYKNLT